ncbi:MAG: AAA family ATPase [Lachnospiraceae bacterium]
MSVAKSTVASNVSAALAQMGKKVLHIGCDPKADSTRCLTKARIPTVLQQLEVLGDGGTREDYVFPGTVPGVWCVEAGGPRAGRGCAGMGITAMEAELDRLGVLKEDWDVILYDVLGDVVCGGFSVPMRKHFVDAVFIVSSSDFMSVFAANNILSAVSYYFGHEKNLMGGFIWNRCRGDWDLQVAESFAQMTRTKILCRLKESDEIRRSDYQRVLFVEQSPLSQPAGEIQKLAERILSWEGLKNQGEENGIYACTEEELEQWRQNLQGRTER